MANKYDWFARRRNYDQEIKSSIRIPTSLHPLRQNATSTTISSNAGSIRPLSQSSRSSSTSSLNTQTASKSAIGHNLAEIKEQNFVDPLGVTLAAENAGSSLLGVANSISDSIGGDPLSNHSGSAKSMETEKSRRHVMENSLAENGDSEGMNGRMNGDEIDGFSSKVLDEFEPWSAKRAAILQKYTTNEKLSIVTSFLPGGIPLQTQVTVTDKLKHR